jgi:hypothetical protein
VSRVRVACVLRAGPCGVGREKVWAGHATCCALVSLLCSIIMTALLHH